MVALDKIMMGATLLPTSNEPLVPARYSGSSLFCLLHRSSLSEKDSFLLETSGVSSKTCQFCVVGRDMPLVAC